MEIDDTDETNIICLESARDRFTRGKCDHRQIIVDEQLAEVECKSCGEKLNPISVLLRFAYEETRWKRNLEAIRDAREKLDKKIRTKCQHCKRMTRINI